MKSLVVLLLSSLLSISVAQAQLLIPGTNLTVTTVNGGTGSLVSIPIPGDSGLSITVGHGSAALPLQNINNMTDSTLIQLGDDGWRNVPLPFQFPYWGQAFDQSTMYSNGVVQFGRPVPAGGWPTWNNAFCCHGEDLRNSTNSGYNYSIMPLWTDLVDTTGQTAYYRGTENSMTYGWYNTSQFGQPNNRSTFELKINSSGAFDSQHNDPVNSYSYAPNKIRDSLLHRQAKFNEFTDGINVNMVINGSTNICVGKTINVTIPITGTTHDKEFDKYYTGKFLITKLKHSFDQITKRHEIALTASKDSFFESLPDEFVGPAIPDGTKQETNTINY